MWRQEQAAAATQLGKEILTTISTSFDNSVSFDFFLFASSFGRVECLGRLDEFECLENIEKLSENNQKILVTEIKRNVTKLPINHGGSSFLPTH